MPPSFKAAAACHVLIKSHNRECGYGDYENGTQTLPYSFSLFRKCLLCPIPTPTLSFRERIKGRVKMGFHKRKEYAV